MSPAPARPSRHGAEGEQLHVSADLRVDVVASDGREAHVVVRDDGGTLVVVVRRPADLRVLGASLPHGLAGVAGQAARLARRGELPLPPWHQPVELVVGSTVIARRRGGRWSPGPRAAAPAAAAVAGLLVVAGLVVAVLGRRRRP